MLDIWPRPMPVGCVWNFGYNNPQKIDLMNAPEISEKKVLKTALSTAQVHEFRLIPFSGDLSTTLLLYRSGSSPQNPKRMGDLFRKTSGSKSTEASRFRIFTQQTFLSDPRKRCPVKSIGRYFGSNTQNGSRLGK